MPKQAVILLSMLCACLDFAFAARFMPVLTNLPMAQFEAQNWCITQDENDIIYVANNAGILEYDGTRWELTPVEGESVVRSVHAEGDRVYAGAFEEFGYYKRDEFGILRYTSLSDSIDGFRFENEEIWGITRCGNILYFNSFKTAFAYDGHSVSIVGSDQNLRPLYIFTAAGKLYAQMVDGGIYILDNNKWRELFSRDATGGDNAVDIMPLAGNVGLLAFTEHSGIFLMRDGNLSPWPTDIDKALRDHRINRVAATRDGLLWIGTLSGGIYTLDKNGRQLYHYDMDYGLNNNSVLGLYADSNDNIWASLDDGLALIHHGSPVKMLTAGKTDPRLGMVYGIGRIGGDLCFAANQGFFRLDSNTGLLSEHPGLRGQNWDISSFDGTSFVANNINTYIYDRAGNESIYPDNSTDIARGRVNGRDILVQSSYHSLRVFTLSPAGGWKFSHVVEGFGAPVRNVSVDAKGNIWCAHINRGIFQIRLSDDLSHIESQKYFPSLSASSRRGDFSIMTITGETFFTDGDSLYVFDRQNSSFSSAHSINRDLPHVKDICSATAVNDTLFWLATYDSYTLAEYSDGHFSTRLSVPVALFPRRNNRTNGKVFVDTDGTSYLALNGTVASVDREAKSYLGVKRPVLALSRVESRSDDSISYYSLNPENIAEISNSVRFLFSYPAFEGEPTRFYFSLAHRGDSTTRVSDTPETSYLNLSPGEYTLTARAEDDSHGVSNTVAYRFRVPTPLPLRWWAIMLYVITIIAVGYIFSHIRVKYRLRHQKLEFDARHAEQQALMLEQQRIIAEQKTRLLESEPTSKSKELASMALNVTSKQQVIDSLRQSLNDRRHSYGSDTRLASEMLRKIESENTNSREFWSVFERNFDLIHEHFFRNLRARYPALTPGDLKFCALLRLNLSTKEIAGFTNLTIRGVETARYRLRRKLALPEGTSLVQFLISFNDSDPENKNKELPPPIKQL